MSLHSHLLAEYVQFLPDEHVLILNSTMDPLIPLAGRRLRRGKLTLAEDNVAVLHDVLRSMSVTVPVRHVAFHDYILHYEPSTVDVAVMNLLYQPAKSWILYGLKLALYALHPGGHLYVEGAKDRGIVTIAKHLEEIFGNVETVKISKGHRVLRAVREPVSKVPIPSRTEIANMMPSIFADQKLDEGTRLLLETLQVQSNDIALDLGCGAGFIGISMAQRAIQGHVTMVDASLAAVMFSQQEVQAQNLTNVTVLSSDGVDAVRDQQFSLVATNPPFHQGGIQTTAIAERFIRETALILQPQGRFYLVANRFLKYEPVLQECFRHLQEVGGNTRYKVLYATHPVKPHTKTRSY